MITYILYMYVKKKMRWGFLNYVKGGVHVWYPVLTGNRIKRFRFEDQKIIRLKVCIKKNRCTSLIYIVRASIFSWTELLAYRTEPCYIGTSKKKLVSPKIVRFRQYNGSVRYAKKSMRVPYRLNSANVAIWTMWNGFLF